MSNVKKDIEILLESFESLDKQPTKYPMVEIELLCDFCTSLNKIETLAINCNL